MQAAAEETAAVATVVVHASRTSGLGQADSASAGVVTGQQLAARAVYRPAELLETAPGLIVSQHSGEGKANQFYLRGFNLDHGTDLRTTVDGMLVNQRSHAHGQGWTDLNFLIPELAERMDFRKGPYSAEHGDFGAMRSGRPALCRRAGGRHRQRQRGAERLPARVLADSPHAYQGHLLYALEGFHNDGPFTRGDDFRKFNGVLRYSRGTAADGLSLTAMAYRAPGMPPTRFPCAPCATAAWAASTRSTPATAARRTATACRAAGAPARTRARRRSQPRWSPAYSTCIRTSPISWTIPSTATSSASRTGASRRR
ncbi:Plug domain-containing protein [Massilia sp. H-1]|nr:Plug domain-containing protein [Massilia sp. H-1]